MAWFKKNHVKFLILKIIPQLLNLTSNFEKKCPLSKGFLKHHTFGTTFKNHLKKVILKILPPFPNFTSNFETYRNASDNLDYIYK